jgi:hypothetical protein
LLALCGFVPVVRGGYRAHVRGESDEHAIADVMLAHELAEVELAALPHLGRACATEMGVVHPGDDLRADRPAVEELHQRSERLVHVPVAQVPRRHLAQEQRAVVLLCIPDEARILLGIERVIAARPR